MLGLSPSRRQIPERRIPLLVGFRCVFSFNRSRYDLDGAPT
jgi:hypothetical protein